jgi:superfamily II DNA or RNA helicase
LQKGGHSLTIPGLSEVALDSALPRFSKEQVVVLRSSMEVGVVVDEPLSDAGEFWYRVQFGTRVENRVEEDLDELSEEFRKLETLALAGRWGTLRSFRCALTIERLTRSNRNTVYSFNAQRILFEPYQYKPLLKILDSPDRRLLIADEVGLGKTIEAALVLTELEARQEVERVVVACPSRLRDKWREELNRKFDQDFEIYTAQTLREYLTRVSQNPDRARLRAILSMSTLRNADLLQLIEATLGYIDVVIVDEAHHGRNPGTQTSEMLRDLARIGGSVLFLTATPLHLGTRDLFTLLQALRPTEFRDAPHFDDVVRRFATIHHTAALVRSGRGEALANAAEELNRLFGPGSTDPLATQVIDELRNSPPRDRKSLIDLDRRITELHPLSSIVTRTRKRDVHEHVAVRRARVFRCKWTEEEDRAYRQFIGSSAQLGWLPESLTLGQIQRARQAASSIHAALLKGTNVRARSDDEAVEVTDILPSEVVAADEAPGRSPVRPDLPKTDSKYDALRYLLGTVWAEEPDAKVLIFTFFVGTAMYLSERLNAEGHSAIVITGQVRSDPRNPEQDERGHRLAAFKSDRRVQVLVSTEVGSEGLDFQFCHHVVNYDLPWNPMVVEQRIGRIDRYGQKSEVIQIHNLVVEGTVEDRILLRLYDRIGIFRESIGDLEAILGETVRELQREYLSGQLTPAEAEQKVEQAARAIENRRLITEQLEQAAGQLFGHEEYIRQEMIRIGHLGRHVSGQSLIALVETFLQKEHPDVRIWADDTNIYGLRMTDALEADIRASCMQGQIWRRRLRGDWFFTTVGAVAFDRTDVELLNASHPLVRAAVERLTPGMSRPEALVGHCSLRLQPHSDPELSAGRYYIAVFAHTVTGVNPIRELDAVVWRTERGGAIEEELGERLLHLVIDGAEEWSSALPPRAVTEEEWKGVLSEARRRHNALRDRKRLENEALYQRRRQAVEAEHAHNRRQIETRRNTAIERGRSDHIVGLFEAQLLKADGRFREQITALEAGRSITTSLSDPLAACAVIILR